MINGAKKIILLSIVASIALAKTVDTNITTTVISGGNENITVTQSGNIHTDNNVSIDINSTLQAGFTVLNDGNISSDNNISILLEQNNSGSVINNGLIESNSSAGIEINGTNFGTVLNEKDGNITSIKSSIFIVNNKNSVINRGVLASRDNAGIEVGENNGTILNDVNGVIQTQTNSAVFVDQDNLKNITNKGLISTVGGDGIYVNHDNNGTILNAASGIIKSQGNMGIVVGNNNYGTIQNDGNISTYDNGIKVVADNYGNIINNYLIKTNWSSIYIAGNNLKDITNNGFLESNASRGIEIRGDNNGTIINEKDAVINTTSTDGSNIYVNLDNNKDIINKGTLAGEGYGVIVAQVNNGNIQNDGEIYTNNNGIVVGENGINGNIVNNNTIEDFWSSIYVVGSNEGNITNNGTLESFSAMGIEIKNNNDGIITNNGTIISNYYGIIADGNNTNKIENNGIIHSVVNGIEVGENNKIILNDKKGVITAGLAAIVISGSEGGNVTNDGTISGHWSLYSSSDSGTFVNNGKAEGSIEASGMDIVNNGTLKTDISVTANSFTQNTSGTFDTGVYINSDTLSALSGSITADGNVTFNDGSVINVDVHDTSLNTLEEWYATLSDANVSGYKEFNASEGIIAQSNDGNVSADVNKLKFTDNSLLFDFSAENNGTVMKLIVKKATGALSNIVNSSGNTFAGGAAGALDKIFSSSNINKDINTFFSSLESQSTDAQRVQSIAETTPEATVTASMASVQSTNAISGAIGARQRGANSGDSLFKDRNLWIKPYYISTTQDDKDGYKGYSADTGGFVLGMDGEYESAKRFGVAFGYSKSIVKTNGLPQSSDIKGYTFAAYGSSPVIDYKSMFSYQLGYGVQRVNTNRYISATAQTATAEYNAKVYYAQAVLNRNIALEDNRFTFVPRVKFAYRHYHTPSYSESGAGGLDLNVNSSNKNEAVIGTGGNLLYRMDDRTNISAYANVEYNLNNDRQTVSASFQGADGVVFETEGLKNSPFTFSGGMSLSSHLKNNSTISFGFNLDRKTSGYTSKGIFAKYNLKF